MDKNSFEAQLLHTPFDKEDAYHSLSMPVYNMNSTRRKPWKRLFADARPIMPIRG